MSIQFRIISIRRDLVYADAVAYLGVSVRTKCRLDSIEKRQKRSTTVALP